MKGAIALFMYHKKETFRDAENFKWESYHSKAVYGQYPILQQKPHYKLLYMDWIFVSVEKKIGINFSRIHRLECTILHVKQIRC